MRNMDIVILLHQYFTFQKEWPKCKVVMLLWFKKSKEKETRIVDSRADTWKRISVFHTFIAVLLKLCHSSYTSYRWLVILKCFKNLRIVLLRGRLFISKGKRHKGQVKRFSRQWVNGCCISFMIRIIFLLYWCVSWHNWILIYFEIRYLSM